MRIGVDLGGSKTEAIALDDGGRELARKRLPTPRDSYEEIIATIVRLVTVIEADLQKTASIGIGTPGALSRVTGLLKNSNTTCLNGKPLLLDLEQAFGRPVRLANDANCFALSEATDGSAANAAVVFGVILGTGVGGGVVAHGRLLEGANAIGGEWGHNPLPWARDDELPGTSCYCGKKGCIETFLSGAGLVAEHQRQLGVREPQHALEVEEIVSRSERGEPKALRTLLAYEDRLARGLASVINILDPDVIVLGGGLSNIESLYESIPRLWPSYVFSDVVRTRLVRAVHGDSSGVRGAAWLWPAENRA
jgi:predicted NBD/HSP70 family sugar kinase